MGVGGGNSGNIKGKKGTIAEVNSSNNELRTSDDDVQQILTEMVKQMKIMNLHLALMTDNIITKQEVDG